MFLIKWLVNEDSYLSFKTDANSNEPLISKGFKTWSFQKDFETSIIFKTNYLILNNYKINETYLKFDH